MLNVLLSFAQYERELTGERIRDKFEASRQKGMWMGGYIPIGYDLKDRRLIINDSEAYIIRKLFEIFITTESITDTARTLNNLGYKTKSWTSSKGILHAGKRFNKNSIRRILENQLYIGNIEHKDRVYNGLHDAIIDINIWNKAHRILNSRRHKVSIPNSRVTQAPLLKGIMNCGICGSRMTPTHTSKSGKRYRYYVCSSKYKGDNDLCKVGRISAHETESLVTDQVLRFIKKPEFMLHTLNSKSDDLSENKIINSFKSIDKIWDELFPVEQVRIMNLLVKKVDIRPDGLKVKIYKDGLDSLSTELTG